MPINILTSSLLREKLKKEDNLPTVQYPGRDSICDAIGKEGTKMKTILGFWAATGLRLVFILAAIVVGDLWLVNDPGYEHAFHNMVYIDIALVIGVPAMLFIHYLAGTRPAPFSLYIPGVRNFDGSYVTSKPSSDRK